MPLTKEEYKRWYEANRETVRAKQRAYYQANRETINAKQLEWARSNPEKRAAIMARHHATEKWRRGHRERQRLYRKGRLPNKKLHLLRVTLFIRQSGCCGICGKQLDPNRIDIDHIVPRARGGTNAEENIQAAHPKCNRIKGARLP